MYFETKGSCVLDDDYCKTALGQLKKQGFGYSTHGGWADLNEIIELELDRENYVDPKLIEYNQSGHFLAIWVTAFPKDAYWYFGQILDERTGEYVTPDPKQHPELLEQLDKISLNNTIIWASMYDGAGGFLLTTTTYSILRVNYVIPPTIIKLDVTFIKSDFEYMCSENAASMYINYKTQGRTIISPETLSKRGCIDIFTIKDCISKAVGESYVVIYSPQGNISIRQFAEIIKYLIKKKEPIIASIIPDANMKKYLAERSYEKTLLNYLHTILIVGYIKDTQIMLVHDQKPFEKLDIFKFVRLSKRTKHIFVMRQDFAEALIKKYDLAILLVKP
jgi:hypothetical protein